MKHGIPVFSKPSVAEAAMMALYDAFTTVINRHGERAARNFVASLQANKESGMRIIYVPDNPRLEPTMPKGGLLTELKQAADAAKEQLRPLQEDLKAFGEQRRVLRAKQSELSDPDSLDQMAEFAENEIKIKLIDRKLASISAQIESGPGRDWAVTSRTYNLAESTAANLEREVTDLAQQLVRALANLHYHTGRPEHAVLTCEVPK